MSDQTLNEQEAVDEAEAILGRAKLRQEILDSLAEMEPEVRQEIFRLAVKRRLKLIVDPSIKAFREVIEAISKAFESFAVAIGELCRQCFGGFPHEYASAGYPCGKSWKGLARWQRRQRTDRRKQWRRERGLASWQR